MKEGLGGARQLGAEEGELKEEEEGEKEGEEEDGHAPSPERGPLGPAPQVGRGRLELAKEGRTMGAAPPCLGVMVGESPG